VILAAAGALAAGAGLAQSGPEVLKAKGCNNCHEADKKKVGPSYKDIAAKGKDAKALVAVLKDAKGHPKVAASEAELDAAVTHILSMK
jgi:cytochrome c551/c552